MQLLWERGVLSATQIRTELYPENTPSNQGTVQKLLQRLEAKHFISRDRTHHVHFFEARTSREAYAGEQLQSLANELTGGSVVPFITHLVKQRKLTAKEQRAIQELLKKKPCTK